MLWLKLLIAALVIAFCILIGYLAANKYRQRKKFFAQFQLFNERYLNELDYARKPLSVFLKEYTYSGEFSKALEAFAAQKPMPKLSFLTKEEASETADYFSMLGKGDAQSQSGFFGARKGILERKKTESEGEAKKRGELYLKLGLLAGLAIVILIV